MAKIQKHKLNEEHRRVLINYLIYFHLACKIEDDKTLFLAVQLFDRYLSKVQVSSKHLQLVGSACMLIAEKYEEIYPNSNKTYVKLAANSFTVSQLQATERKI